MNKFAIVTNTEKDRDFEITKKLEKILDEKKLKHYRLEASNLEEETNCIIVIGGDGTLLITARKFIDENIPLLGINLGTLGFLVEVSTEAMKEAIEQIIDGNYSIQERMLIKGELIGNNKYIKSFALNDIVLSKESFSSTIRYRLKVNDKLLYKYNGDGIIISTPTGSTGYCLSAGGPIVEPTAELFVITPICAHTLVSRSVVLSADDKIEVEIIKFRDNIEPKGHIINDGIVIGELRVEEKIRITKSKKKVRLLKLDEESFLETMRRKMNV